MNRYKGYNGHHSIQKMNIYSCCSTNDVIEDLRNGVLVCQNCGTVKEENIMLPSYADIVDHCEETVDEDVPNIYFKPTTRMQYYLVMNSISSKQKGRKQIALKIDDMCEEMTEKVRIEAKRLYSIMNKNNIFRGKVLNGMISCCILNACKNVREERTVQEISCLTNVDTHQINKCNKRFLSLMKTHCTNHDDIETVNTTFLIRTCLNQLKFLSKIEKMAIIQYIEAGFTKYAYIFDGKKKKSKIVALIIYYLEKQYDKGRQYKKEISNTLDVTIVTINKMLKQLRSFDENHLSNVEQVIT